MTQEFKQLPKIIITGGGSGGHLSVAKALIDYMFEEDYDVKEKVLFVGGKLGMISDKGLSLDERWIPEFGVDYEFIRGGKLHRRFHWKTFMLFWGVVPGLYDAYRVIKRFNPQIIFATGGYVALPMIVIGRLLGKRVVIHEQTLTAGLANKIGSKFADRILVTFEESKKYFPINKTIVTGNIIRKEVFNNNPAVANQALVKIVDKAKREGHKVIYITGGSLGAHKINEFIEKNIKDLAFRYCLIWQIGDNKYHNDYERVEILINELNLNDRIYITKFVKSEIGYILSNCDIVVCRPGANTLYELAALNKKAILIPLWVTSKSDQLTNANWFVANHLGKILEEKSLNTDTFINSVNELVSSSALIDKKDYQNNADLILKAILG